MALKKFALAGLAVLLSSPAFAGDLKGETVNAIEHAQYAADATSIDTAHMHLHHSLNCIVGPKGMGFDAKQLNPCANAGNGIIPDSAGANKAALEAAAAKARDGLASNDPAAVKADALSIVTTLKGLK
ncbi:MAG TPA: hypothetical protein VIJ85_12125 [Rhizomicrobium sp.]